MHSGISARTCVAEAQWNGQEKDPTVGDGQRCYSELPRNVSFPGACWTSPRDGFNRVIQYVISVLTNPVSQLALQSDSTV